MKALTLTLLAFIVVGCAKEDLSMISIRNQTEVPILTLPYSSEFAEGEWIPPGGMDDFYSINCDCLDAFEYFSFYYDSLIIYLEDHEDNPVKFYPDGTTLNYDPLLNPFTNPNVWRIREFTRYIDGPLDKSNDQETHISEHYISITTEHITSLSDTVTQNLNPAP